MLYRFERVRNKLSAWDFLRALVGDREALQSLIKGDPMLLGRQNDCFLNQVRTFLCSSRRANGRSLEPRETSQAAYLVTS